MNVRRVGENERGFVRRKHGRGFRYLNEHGDSLGNEDKARIKSLVIPPAWTEVWICVDAHGHIQATGIDGQGRKQYIYHVDFRSEQERRKFDHMLEFAAVLPTLRAHVLSDLQSESDSQTQILALAVRLLDRGFFRIGSEQYAEAHETYGLATLQRTHVRVIDNEIHYQYNAKHGKEASGRIVDPLAAPLVKRLKQHRQKELLAYKDSGTWHDLRSTDINAYLKLISGIDATAKDFRTWKATVIAAVSLAVAIRPDSESGIQKVETYAVKQAAHYLGNTPAVCRSSYIDPRVFQAYNNGKTAVLSGLDAIDESEIEIHEPAVIKLLSNIS